MANGNLLLAVLNPILRLDVLHERTLPFPPFDNKLDDIFEAMHKLNKLPE